MNYKNADTNQSIAVFDDTHSIKRKSIKTRLSIQKAVRKRNTTQFNLNRKSKSFQELKSNL